MVVRRLQRKKEKRQRDLLELKKKKKAVRGIDNKGLAKDGGNKKMDRKVFVTQTRQDLVTGWMWG